MEWNLCHLKERTPINKRMKRHWGRVRNPTSWVTHEYVSEYGEWLSYSYSRVFGEHNTHLTHTHGLFRTELLTLLILTHFENCSTHAHSYSLTLFFEWTHNFLLMLWAWVSQKIRVIFAVFSPSFAEFFRQDSHRFAGLFRQRRLYGCFWKLSKVRYKIMIWSWMSQKVRGGRWDSRVFSRIILPYSMAYTALLKWHACFLSWEIFFYHHCMCKIR